MYLGKFDHSGAEGGVVTSEGHREYLADVRSGWYGLDMHLCHRHRRRDRHRTAGRTYCVHRYDPLPCSQTLRLPAVSPSQHRHLRGAQQIWEGQTLVTLELCPQDSAPLWLKTF